MLHNQPFHMPIFLNFPLRSVTLPFYSTTLIGSSWFSKRAPSACSSSFSRPCSPICCPAHGAVASAACMRYFLCPSPSDLCQNTSANSFSSAKVVFKSTGILVVSVSCCLRVFLPGSASTQMIPAIPTQSRLQPQLGLRASPPSNEIYGHEFKMNLMCCAGVERS